MTLTEISAFVIVFSLAFCIAILLTPFAIWLSPRLGAMTKPGGRRHEIKPVPRPGGIPIFGAFFIAAIVAQFVAIPRFDDYELIRLAGLLIGASLLFIAGLLDDIYEFSWLPQYLSQMIAAGIAVLFQIFIEFFNNPLTGQQTDPWIPLVTITLSLLWLVIMMNTVNFMDGLDGLAAGVGVIACAMLFIHSAFILKPAQLSVSLLPLALMGACAGFLLFNFAPAQIYLGGGAPMLGFLLGALSIIGGAKMATILLVMGLPLMDFAWQVFNRVRQRRSPLSGDRGHLHFRLLDSGFLTMRQIVLLYYMFCAFFGILTLLLESQLFKFIAFGMMLALILIGFALLVRFNHPQSSSS